MKSLRSIAGACALLLGASVAQAAPVNLDFSTLGLAEGQSVEGSTFGIATFTSEVPNLFYTNSYGAGFMSGNAATGDIYVSFAGGVSAVSVRAGDGSGDLDAFAVSAYAFGTNAFLGTFSTPAFGGPAEPEWYTLNVSGLGLIGRIVFDPGNAGSLPGSSQATGGVIMTDLSYDGARAVPEPATFALVGLGLAGMARRRLRA